MVWYGGGIGAGVDNFLRLQFQEQGPSAGSPLQSETSHRGQRGALQCGQRLTRPRQPQSEGLRLANHRPLFIADTAWGGRDG